MVLQFKCFTKNLQEQMHLFSHLRVTNDLRLSGSKEKWRKKEKSHRSQGMRLEPKSPVS